MTSSAAPLPRLIGPAPGVPATDVRSVHSLYVHIPFCERKCEYCDFTSVAGLRGEVEYMEALRAEIRLLGALFPDTRLDTVFVGGGTPSLVDPRSLAALLDDIGSAFAIDARAEVTLEANPSSTSLDRAAQWRSAGFTRVSIGVQSLERDVLAFLGRVHDAPRALAAVDEVRAAGFTSVNCDLIYAVPGLDDRRWVDTLRRVVAAGPTHVSCYELTVEPGTPLHRSVRSGVVTPVTSEPALRQHRIAVDLLQAAGLEQYEVSNFAAAGEACRHNLAYWHNNHYLAAGVGAHGHLPGAGAGALGLPSIDHGESLRYWHGRGIARFVASMRSGRIPIQGHEAVDRQMREFERVMLGLRLNGGVVVDGGRVQDELAALVEAGLVVQSGHMVRVTPRGENVLNAVALRIADAAA